MDSETEKHLAVLNLDFSKAFDKVCHERLHEKLASLGVGGNFSSYFTPILQTGDNLYRLTQLCHPYKQFLVVYRKVQCWDHFCF